MCFPFIKFTLAHNHNTLYCKCLSLTHLSLYVRDFLLFSQLLDQRDENGRVAVWAFITLPTAYCACTLGEETRTHEPIYNLSLASLLIREH